MSSFTWEGDFISCNFWRPFAEGKQRQLDQIVGMRSLSEGEGIGTGGKALARSLSAAFSPVAGVWIMVQVNPHHIHIKAEPTLASYNHCIAIAVDDIYAWNHYYQPFVSVSYPLVDTQDIPPEKDPPYDYNPYGLYYDGIYSVKAKDKAEGDSSEKQDLLFLQNIEGSVYSAMNLNAVFPGYYEPARRQTWWSTADKDLAYYVLQSSHYGIFYYGREYSYAEAGLMDYSMSSIPEDDIDDRDKSNPLLVEVCNKVMFVVTPYAIFWGITNKDPIDYNKPYSIPLTFGCFHPVKITTIPAIDAGANSLIWYEEDPEGTTKTFKYVTQFDYVFGDGDLPEDILFSPLDHEDLDKTYEVTLEQPDYINNVTSSFPFGTNFAESYSLTFGNYSNYGMLYGKYYYVGDEVIVYPCVNLDTVVGPAGRWRCVKQGQLINPGSDGAFNRRFVAFYGMYSIAKAPISRDKVLSWHAMNSFQPPEGVGLTVVHTDPSGVAQSFEYTVAPNSPWLNSGAVWGDNDTPPIFEFIENIPGKKPSTPKTITASATSGWIGTGQGFQDSYNFTSDPIVGPTVDWNEDGILTEEEYNITAQWDGGAWEWTYNVSKAAELTETDETFLIYPSGCEFNHPDFAKGWTTGAFFSVEASGSYSDDEGHTDSHSCTFYAVGLSKRRYVAQYTYWNESPSVYPGVTYGYSGYKILGNVLNRDTGLVELITTKNTSQYELQYTASGSLAWKIYRITVPTTIVQGNAGVQVRPDGVDEYVSDEVRDAATANDAYTGSFSSNGSRSVTNSLTPYKEALFIGDTQIIEYSRSPTLNLPVAGLTIPTPLWETFNRTVSTTTTLGSSRLYLEKTSTSSDTILSSRKDESIVFSNYQAGVFQVNSIFTEHTDRSGDTPTKYPLHYKRTVYAPTSFLTVDYLLAGSGIGECYSETAKLGDLDSDNLPSAEYTHVSSFLAPVVEQDCLLEIDIETDENGDPILDKDGNPIPIYEKIAPIVGFLYTNTSNYKDKLSYVDDVTGLETPQSTFLLDTNSGILIDFFYIVDPYGVEDEEGNPPPPITIWVADIEPEDGVSNYIPMLNLSVGYDAAGLIKEILKNQEPPIEG